MRTILTKHRIVAAFLSLCMITTMFSGMTAFAENSAGAKLSSDMLERFSAGELTTVELDRLIEQEVTDHPDEYSDLWEKPQIKESNQRDFYVTQQGLVIFYQPYDLSYYARGFVEFTIDYADISGYLKEEYRRLVPQ